MVLFFRLSCLIAGVTRRFDTISPQFMWPGAQIA
jgi:hypothetical protein